jgi:hypothetical protein
VPTARAPEYCGQYRGAGPSAALFPPLCTESADDDAVRNATSSMVLKITKIL